MKEEQQTLFDMPPPWEEHWKGMPSYEHDELSADSSVKIHFRNKEDRRKFGALIGQPLGPKQLSLWYPAAEIARYSNKLFKAESETNPRYPVYIISKGRHESRNTSRHLDKIGVPYHIVIEPQEYRAYSSVIDPAKILTLPFSNLGQGSIPARNWVWDHAIGTGAERHWILDDNINGFYRFQKNLKTPVGDGAIFRAAEDYVDRYMNVAIAGFNYFMFVTRKSPIPPITLNTRIYSCILLKNDLPYRWRGRYNEDTDLSIRVLKDGLCTVLFNAFLAYKLPTMTMKGGNTDELYQGDGRLKMAESLRDQHPDIVHVTTKFKRPQHHVNYKIFRRNKLVLKPDAKIPNERNDYDMSLYLLEDQQ